MSAIAWVFPGQGSQTIGMLQDLQTQHAVIQQTFNEVSLHLGYDIWDLTQQGPLEKLNQTEYTQVVMLVADVALYRASQATEKSLPVMMAGHSLGEYAALVCADAIDLCAAASLVEKRGQLMQSTVPMGQGAMAAIIGLSDEIVEDICKEACDDNTQVTIANYNAIGQVVVAGHTAAVLRAIEIAEKKDARMAKVIPVSVPCHCPLLKEAAELFKHALSACEFRTPNIAVVSNVDCSVYRSPEHIRHLLEEQLYKPVRWVETIQLMKQKEIDTVRECGPGKVLSGLIKRIDKSLQSESVLDILKV